MGSRGTSPSRRSCVDAAASPEHGFSMTPLHISAVNHDARTTRVLAAGGASVSAKDTYGRTPFDVSLLLGARSVVNTMHDLYQSECTAM